MSKSKKEKIHLTTKIKEWIHRYGLAEVTGTIGAYIGFFLTQNTLNNNIAAAYAGVIGENLGFYSVIISKEILRNIKRNILTKKKYLLKRTLKTTKNLITEFGPAEALDSLIIRPFTIGFGSRYLGRKIGVLTGKVIADIVFYIPVIISYELRKTFRHSEKILYTSSGFRKHNNNT